MKEGGRGVVGSRKRKTARDRKRGKLRERRHTACA